MHNEKMFGNSWFKCIIYSIVLGIVDVCTCGEHLSMPADANIYLFVSACMSVSVTVLLKNKNKNKIKEKQNEKKRKMKVSH